MEEKKEESRLESLSLLLIGLALLERNGKTYVNREIREVISEIEREMKNI